MSAREELAAVLAEHEHRSVHAVGVGRFRWTCRCGATFDGDLNEMERHVADALLASPALARVIREAKAEAWDEGRRDTRAGWLDPTHYVFNPYRDQTEDPT